MGRWTFTPLERPKEFVNKPMLTDQEAAALAKRLRDQAVAGDSVRPGAGNPGGYSQEAWTDRARGDGPESDFADRRPGRRQDSAAFA